VEVDPLALEPLDPDPLEPVDPLDPEPLAALRFADAVALPVPCDSEREAVEATAPVFARAGSFPVAIRT
jgi:hypothetical protein